MNIEWNSCTPLRKRPEKQDKKQRGLFNPACTLPAELYNYTSLLFHILHV